MGWADPEQRPRRFADFDDEDLALIAAGVVPEVVRHAAVIEWSARRREALHRPDRVSDTKIPCPVTTVRDKP